MGLRIISGTISCVGYPPQGVVEITYNPLAVMSATRGNVSNLRAYGDNGYFATEPFALISTHNLTLEDMINPGGNKHNTIYMSSASFVTNPEHQFQRILYHRIAITWNYACADYTQGRISKLSFMIVGDAVPLESLPLQPLPAGGRLGKLKLQIAGRIVKKNLQEIPRALPSRKPKRRPG